MLTGATLLTSPTGAPPSAPPPPAAPSSFPFFFPPAAAPLVENAATIFCGGACGAAATAGVTPLPLAAVAAVGEGRRTVDDGLSGVEVGMLMRDSPLRWWIDPIRSIRYSPPRSIRLKHVQSLTCCDRAAAAQEPAGHRHAGGLACLLLWGGVRWVYVADASSVG